MNTEQTSKNIFMFKIDVWKIFVKIPRKTPT